MQILGTEDERQNGEEALLIKCGMKRHIFCINHDYCPHVPVAYPRKSFPISPICRPQSACPCP